MPKVSIIIPVYNVKPYLKEALDSLVNQTLKDIEIICIDDCSTDKSWDILQEYAQRDNRFILIKQETNQGPGAARNIGLDIAKGEYIAFMDSDDKLCDNVYFESLYNACTNYNADIAIAGIKKEHKGKFKNILSFKQLKIVEDYRSKLEICDVPTYNYVWNKLYKRQSLLKTGLKFEQNAVYEDIIYTPKILYYMEKIVTVPNVAYFYRKRNGSIVNTKNKNYINDFKNAEAEANKFFLEHNIKPSDLYKQTKKYKLGKITIFKTITKNNIQENILFNVFRWKKLLKEGN